MTAVDRCGITQQHYGGQRHRFQPSKQAQCNEQTVFLRHGRDGRGGRSTSMDASGINVCADKRLNLID